MKKRALTLLEVTIALALLSLLFTYLFGAYHQMILGSTRLEKPREYAFASKYTQQRLAKIFSTLVYPSDKENPSLYTHEERLIVKYDNGLDRDPSFCKEITSELFLNETNDICLLTRGKLGLREEILWEGVEELEWTFFDLETKKNMSSWDKKKQGPLPVMLRLKLSFKKNNSPLEFAFFIPHNHPIVYKTL